MISNEKQVRTFNGIDYELMNENYAIGGYYTFEQAQVIRAQWSGKTKLVKKAEGYLVYCN